MFLETPASEQAAQVSPDGRWLAYSSDETGTWESFVRAVDGSGGKWQISTGGGYGPRWSPESDEIFYRWENSLYSVKLDGSGGGVRWSRPQTIFDDLPLLVLAESSFDVLSRDRFLLTTRVRNDDESVGITVVVNWLDDLTHRLNGVGS